MFPIDSNLLIGILIVAAIIVYVQILRKLKPQKILANVTSNRESRKQEPTEKESEENKLWKIAMKEAEKLEETETLEEAERLKEKLEEKPEKKVTEKEKHKEKKERIRKGKLRDQVSSSSTCPHEFGYLGTLPKSASIPDECLGCPEIIECLAQK